LLLLVSHSAWNIKNQCRFFCPGREHGSVIDKAIGRKFADIRAIFPTRTSTFSGLPCHIQTSYQFNTVNDIGSFAFGMPSKPKKTKALQQKAKAAQRGNANGSSYGGRNRLETSFMPFDGAASPRRGHNGKKYGSSGEGLGSV
jgi:hypothetical protein